MAATRTQIYLTEAQRHRVDVLRRRTGESLAEVVRAALDMYLDAQSGDAHGALEVSFGALPSLRVPSRDEWDG